MADKKRIKLLESRNQHLEGQLRDVFKKYENCILNNSELSNELHSYKVLNEELESELREMRQKYEPSRQALANVTQGHRPGNQPIPVVQANQGPPANVTHEQSRQANVTQGYRPQNSGNPQAHLNQSIPVMQASQGSPMNVTHEQSRQAMANVSHGMSHQPRNFGKPQVQSNQPIPFMQANQGPPANVTHEQSRQANVNQSMGNQPGILQAPLIPGTRGDQVPPLDQLIRQYGVSDILVGPPVNFAHEQSRQANVTQGGYRPQNSGNPQAQLNRPIPAVQANQGPPANVSHEQSRQANANQNMGYQAQNSGNPQAQLNQSIPAVQDSPVVQLIHKLGLSAILSEPLAFIRKRLKVVNGVLCLNGREIPDVPRFARLIQTKPWVVFPNEYAVECLHCRKSACLTPGTDICFTHNQDGCRKSTPLVSADEGFHWAICSHCSDVWPFRMEAFYRNIVVPCRYCKGMFAPKVYMEKDLIRIPYRRSPPKAVKRPLPTAEGQPEISGRNEAQLDQPIPVMQANQGPPVTHEQSRQANVTQSMGYQSQNTGRQEAQSNQPILVVQANPETKSQKGPPVDHLIHHYGLNNILCGPLAFINERLTAENGVLCLDGEEIPDVPKFTRLIRTKPWVVFSGEYVVDCLHCRNPSYLHDATEEHRFFTDNLDGCTKSTPFLPNLEGYGWTRCDHCWDAMGIKAETCNGNTGVECYSCKEFFFPKLYEDRDVIRTPYWCPPPPEDEKPSPTAEPAGLPR